MKMLRIKLLLQEIYIFGILLIVSFKRNGKRKEKKNSPRLILIYEGWLPFFK